MIDNQFQNEDIYSHINRNTKKTGIKDLDESYVYYSKGATNELLNKVRKAMVVKMSPVQQTIAKARTTLVRAPTEKELEISKTDVTDTLEGS